jgi:hypothetical protein
MWVPVGLANESCHCDVAEAVSNVFADPFHFAIWAVPVPHATYTLEVVEPAHGANEAPSMNEVVIVVSVHDAAFVE